MPKTWLNAVTLFKAGLRDPALRLRAFALGIGFLGGALAARLGVPLPWMLGPMLLCAVAAFVHVPLANPVGLRPYVIPILGVMLGSGFYPDIFSQLTDWASTLLILPMFLVGASAVAYAVFRKLGGYDPTTAFFCAAPGGLNEMILMGGAAGGDETRISLAHAIRVFAVISLVALVFGLVFNVASGDNPAAFIGFSDLSATDLALLAACALAGGPLARLCKLPAPGLLGPMVLSALVHLTGLVALPPPTILVIAAQVTIGTVLGCRFIGARLAETGRDIAIALTATLGMLVITAICAFIVAWTSATQPDQAILAFSPGGLAEMSLLALAMGQDVAYVATLHVVRIVLVLLAVPIMVHYLGAYLFDR